jgi:altronate dehydratase large subunit
VDKLVEMGGSAILCETPEMIGAEHILAKRCCSAGVKDDLYGIIADAERGISSMGVDIRGSNPTPGNMAGGLSSIEEKSLGCIYKAGSSPIMQVVRYADTPSEKGLVIMDTPGHDVESMTGIAAGGAQVCVFTTGLGAVTGFPIMPVIKVCGNPMTSAFMSDNIDIDAGQILEGKASLQQVAEQILGEVMEVSSGKVTKAESLGYSDIAINRIGPTT